MATRKKSAASDRFQRTVSALMQVGKEELAEVVKAEKRKHPRVKKRPQPKA